MKYDRPIHDLMRDCARELQEPFTRGQIVDWFRARYPEISPGSVQAHIDALNGDNGDRGKHHPHLGSRAPVFRQFGRGRYGRWSSAEREPSNQRPVAPAPPPTPPPPPAPPVLATEEWFWEGNVQSALLRHLAGEGWDIVRVADTASREAGTDVVVRRDGRTMHIEVKGWPSSSYRDPAKAHLKKATLPAVQARVWLEGAVVQAMRLRDAHPGDGVALAFPDYPTYRKLVTAIAESLSRLDIGVLVLGEDGRCTALLP